MRREISLALFISICALSFYVMMNLLSGDIEQREAKPINVIGKCFRSNNDNVFGEPEFIIHVFEVDGVIVGLQSDRRDHRVIYAPKIIDLHLFLVLHKELSCPKERELHHSLYRKFPNAKKELNQIKAAL